MPLMRATTMLLSAESGLGSIKRAASLSPLMKMRTTCLSSLPLSSGHRIGAEALGYECVAPETQVARPYHRRPPTRSWPQHRDDWGVVGERPLSVAYLIVLHALQQRTRQCLRITCNPSIVAKVPLGTSTHRCLFVRGRENEFYLCRSSCCEMLCSTPLVQGWIIVAHQLSAPSTTRRPGATMAWGQQDGGGPYNARRLFRLCSAI